MKVDATREAEATVRKVAESGRPDLVMILGTGCCDSTAPFLYDRYVPGPDAEQVGEVAGVPVLAHRWLANLYAGSDGLILDVDQGVVSDFLLPRERVRLPLHASSRGATGVIGTRILTG